MKYFLIVLIALVVIGGVVLVYQNQTNDVVIEPTTTETDPDTSNETEEDTSAATTTEEDVTTEVTERDDETVIGTSVEGREIVAHHFGTGDTELLFIGGTHGGYSWNTPLVAYELIDYLENDPTIVPDNMTVTVIPVLNPDGLYATVGTAGRFSPTAVPADQAAQVAGRFNANGVDLNRNFDCEWEATGTWQDQTVDGGTAPFSEPESQAVRDYVTSAQPAAAVVWYSAAGGVYASNCGGEVDSDTTALTELYANASGYQAFSSYDYYEITGDMVNWMASQDIPAISVLLSDHRNTEWTKNRAGITAVLNEYGQ